MNNQKNSKKPVLIFSAIGVLIVAIIVIISIILTNNYYSTHSSILEIEIQPSDATVLLDGEPVDASSGLVRVTPGDHSIAIIRAGFFPEGEEFSIKKNETIDFDFTLSPFSDEAKKLAEEFED